MEGADCKSHHQEAGRVKYEVAENLEKLSGFSFGYLK